MVKDIKDYFKVHPSWVEQPHPYGPDNILDKIAFVFEMKGNRYRELYLKLKEPKDNYNIGMDCFRFAFDTDNGIYIDDGDMKFNNFMGEEIIDSGADVVGYIRDFLIRNNLQGLALDSKDLKQGI